MFRRPAQRLPKGRVGDIVGGKIHHARHLQHKADRRLVTFAAAAGQFFQMFDAPQRGRVGKTGVAALFQRDALYFHEALAAIGSFPVKVKAGVAPHCFGTQQRQPRAECPGPGPLGKDLVGGLGIHVHQQWAFFHRYQIILRFAGGVVPRGQVDGGPRHQQFPATAGVLYMDGLGFAVQQDPGHKTVGTGQKGCGGYG